MRRFRIGCTPSWPLILALAWITQTARAEPPSKEYELLFEEDFQGDKVNEAHWTYRTGERSGANQFK